MYRMVSGYSGTAENALNGYHNGKPFSTKDRDHDGAWWTHCANDWKGAWWFKDWPYSHLNRKYRSAGGSFPDYYGPVWGQFNNRKALKFAEMKIR